jgi:hypothetical protein
MGSCCCLSPNISGSSCSNISVRDGTGVTAVSAGAPAPVDTSSLNSGSERVGQKPCGESQLQAPLFTSLRHFAYVSITPIEMAMLCGHMAFRCGPLVPKPL